MLLSALSPRADAEHQPGLCADMHGGRRGAAPHFPHPVLLQDLQGSGSLPPSRQHHLWLPGEHRHLPAGEQRILEWEGLGGGGQSSAAY